MVPSLTETEGTICLMTHNERVNLTVRPVTRLAGLLLHQDSNGSAQGARPSRPAGYARRCTDPT